MIKEIVNQAVIKKKKGGKRPGSGRPAGWYRKMCAEQLEAPLGEKAKSVLVLGQIARGEATVEKAFNSDGKIITAEIKVSPTDIIAANSFLADRAFGKPKQEFEHSGSLSLEQIIGASHEE